MKCAFVTIPFRGLMSVNRSNPKSVTYVSGTFVTLDSGLYKGGLGGISPRAQAIVHSFEQFIQDHKDEITALQILYSAPARHRVTQGGKRLTFEHIKEL